MQWSLIFLSVIGLAVSSPVNPPIKETLLRAGADGRNALLEAQLLALLESLREIEEINPLEVDMIHVTDNDVPLPGFDLEIIAAVVSNLNAFVINDLSVRINTIIPVRYRASLDFHFPVLDVKADRYNIHVPLDGGMALFGNGEATIDLIEPRITVNLLVRPIFGLGSLHLTLEECVITVALKAFESKITGLLGGDPAVDAFVNTFLSYLVPDLLITFENQITEIVSPIVMNIANDILSDFNVIDILG